MTRNAGRKCAIAAATLLLVLLPMAAASSRLAEMERRGASRQLSGSADLSPLPTRGISKGLFTSTDDLINTGSPAPSPGRPTPSPSPTSSPGLKPDTVIDDLVNPGRSPSPDRPSPSPDEKSPDPGNNGNGPNSNGDVAIFARGIPKELNAEYERLNNASAEVPPPGGYPTHNWDDIPNPDIDDDTEQIPEDELVELLKLQLEQLLEDDRLLLRGAAASPSDDDERSATSDDADEADDSPMKRGLKAGRPVVGSVLPWIVWPWYPWGLHFWNVSTSWTAPKRLCVYVNKAPVDIMFLADTTGSMYGVINAVKAAASSLMTSLSGTIPNLNVGVAGYKDNGDVYVYRRFAATTFMTPGAFSAALGGAWSASGGGDWPEANLYALRQVASGVGVDDSGWRANAIKVVVWFGDAPGHEPSNGVTLLAARNALLSKGIKVIALNAGNLNQPYGFGPTAQASYLAAQTGGYYGSVTSTNIAATIISSVANVNVVIKPEITCPVNSPFIIEFDPDTVTASPSRPGCFSVRVRLCEGDECAPGGTYVCTVKFIDQSNNNVIDVRPIVIHTAPGVDATPPWFPYVPPTPELRECPSQFACPPLYARDNCDATALVYPTETVSYSPAAPAVGGPTCIEKHHCEWAHADAAGNPAVPVSQDVVIQDTSPPAMSSVCSSSALCLSNNVRCISLERFIDRCFDDKCNDVVKWDVSCDGSCWTEDGSIPSPELQCLPRQGSDDVLCFEFPLRDRPHCCTILATVTDSCGNTATYPMTTCFSPSGVGYPPGAQCLPLTTAGIYFP